MEINERLRSIHSQEKSRGLVFGGRSSSNSDKRENLINNFSNSELVISQKNLIVKNYKKDDKPSLGNINISGS